MLSPKSKTLPRLTFLGLLVLLLSIMNTVAALMLLFYQTQLKEEFKLDIKKEALIPSKAECEGFLKIKRIKSSKPDNRFTTVLEAGREFISRKTYILTAVPVLKDNTIVCTYEVSLDDRVRSDEEIKVQFQNNMKRSLEKKEIAKYLNLSYKWLTADRIILPGNNMPSRVLTLEVYYTLDYEEMKKDGVIKNYLDQNYNTLTLEISCGIQTEE